MSGPAPFAWSIEAYDQLASTSDACLARARAGAVDGLAILARHQTRGRGREGRSWLATSGGLALSVLLRPATPLTTSGQWALLAGLATLEGLAALLPPAARPRLSLKWPNDVLADGAAKLAGVLTEAEPGTDGNLAFLVIGIGANLAVAPNLPDRPTSCLAALGAANVTAEQAAHAVLARLADWRQTYSQGGFAPVRGAWLARAHPLGIRLSVATPGGRLTGRFAGLAESGALRLETEAGPREVVSGEIIGPSSATPEAGA